MKEEIDALEKNGNCSLTYLPLANVHLEVSGFTKSNIEQMGLLKDIRHGC